MKARALVIDDDPVSLSLAADLLEAHGWQCFRALNVREAFIFASVPAKFDMIIIDDHLPDGDFDDIASAFSEPAFIVRISSAEHPEPATASWDLFLLKPWSEKLVQDLLGAYDNDLPPAETMRPERKKPSDAALPLFDRDACRKAFAKHPSLWFRVREGVGRRLPVLLQEIIASSERHDRPRFQHLAHEIGGMLKMLRSQALAERAQRLERLAESAKWDELRAELGALNGAIPQLEAHLDAFGREFQLS